MEHVDQAEEKAMMEATVVEAEVAVTVEAVAVMQVAEQEEAVVPLEEEGTPASRRSRLRGRGTADRSLQCHRW